MKPNIYRAFGLLFLFCALSASPAKASFPGEVHTQGEYHFKVPYGLESRVDFWTKIYTEYSTNHAVVHDSNDLRIIYDIVYLGDGDLSRRQKKRRVNKIKNKYKDILMKLSRKTDLSFLSGEEKRVADLVHRNNFRKRAKYIRFQLGQKDRFREGIMRSGYYIDEIKSIFRAHGLPEELTVLPHVESSFQLGAYSSAGAAGIWQFTRNTGRLFLKVGYQVDERRDPILATYAAAKLLKLNFNKLQDWPLAVTAYNHGLHGMRRAQTRHGSDLLRVIENYNGRTFGFASQNFYAEFLAALHIIRNVDKYFPHIRPEDPIKLASIRLRDYIHVDTLKKYYYMTGEDIRLYNPALRPPVFSGKRRVPKHFNFQVPVGNFDDLEAVYSAIPDSKKFNKQVRIKWYTVRRGDNLSSIASRFGTSAWKLKQINSINNRHRIYKGQVLELPDRAKKQSIAFKVAGASPGGFEPLAKDMPAIDIGETGYYWVRKHDNLTNIAKKFNVSVDALQKLNRIRNPRRLMAGQRLKVPKLVTLALSNSPSLEPSYRKANQEAIKKIFVEIGKPTADTEIIAASAAPSPKGKAKIEIEYESAPASSKTNTINKNRPAFTPVKISDHESGEYSLGTIRVDFDETLSHYADWSRISVREIRRINKLRRKRTLKINRKIVIPFRKSTPEEFMEKRQEYHKAIQEDFFDNYKVEKIIIKNVAKGETLWEICNNDFSIPFWLLSNYNPEKNIHSLSVGEPLVIPVITAADS